MPGAVVAQLEIDDVGGAQLRVPHERRLCRALARLHENRDADAQGHLQALKPRRWRWRDLLEKQPIADFFLSIGRTPQAHSYDLFALGLDGGDRRADEDFVGGV